MIEQTYRVLGYYKLLEIMSRFAASPLGRSDCLSLRPSNEPEQIDNELRQVAEMRLLLKTHGFVSLSDVTDISPLLAKAHTQGGCLETIELLSIQRCAEAGLSALKFIRQRRGLFPLLHGLHREAPGIGDMIKRLKQAIHPNGLIKDSASTELKRIREKKIKGRQDLEKRLETLKKDKGLNSGKQDNLVTVIDGRYVVALRSDQKNRVEGIVHDYSHTRSTCYLEPLEVIGENNRAAELAQEEKAEEYRILKDLTLMALMLSDELNAVQSYLGKMDGLYARARYAETYSCVMPELGRDFGITLKQAMNPILATMGLRARIDRQDGSSPVPADILLDRDHNILIISGPNRGGKTVTLKTLGLLCLMTQAGIHIPAKEGSRLPVFDRFMAEIGDDQDIQAGESTFSAHAGHLKHIVEHAGNNSLVIIDEPGMGTDPDEGTAISMAILDVLCERGAYVAVSTHSNRLKAYGMSNPRAVNAAVEFDDRKKSPTYRLGYGVPGISHALEVAREVGVPREILTRANNYLDKDEVRLNRLIEKLNEKLVQAREEQCLADALKKRLQAALNETAKERESLITKGAEAVESKRREAEAAISLAKEEFNQAVNLLKKRKRVVQSQVTEQHGNAVRNLRAFFDKDSGNEANGPCVSDFRKGDRVFHKKLKQKGLIQSVEAATGRIVILLGNLKISADSGDLEVIQKEQDRSSQKSGNTVTWQEDHLVLREVNVVGFRVEEALPLIDKIIDRAMVEGDSSLRIIHGYGTGVLRKAIRGHLKDMPYIKNIAGEDPKFGGDAITVVEL